MGYKELKYKLRILPEQEKPNAEKVVLILERKKNNGNKRNGKTERNVLVGVIPRLLAVNMRTI